jgi:hypothetical protein
MAARKRKRISLLVVVDGDGVGSFWSFWSLHPYSGTLAT